MREIVTEQITERNVKVVDAKNKTLVLGFLNHVERVNGTGWVFMPNFSGRRGSRKPHKTQEQALKGYKFKLA